MHPSPRVWVLQQRFTALSLTVGVFVAVRDLIAAGNHSVKMIFEALELDSDTRLLFLENIVRHAKKFLNERSNDILFNEMLKCAANEEQKEREGGRKKKKPDKRAKGDWIATELAKCVTDEVHNLFYKLYDVDSLSPREVHAPID